MIWKSYKYVSDLFFKLKIFKNKIDFKFVFITFLNETHMHYKRKYVLIPFEIGD